MSAAEARAPAPTKPQAPATPRSREFAPGVFTLKLEGAIGPKDPISAAKVRRTLFGAGTFNHLHVEINSTGGNVSEAEEIYQLFRALPVPVSARAFNSCQSAAVTIYAAASFRSSHIETEFLIHPTSMMRGVLPERITAEILQTFAAKLESDDRREAQMLSDRTGYNVDWFLEEARTEATLGPADALGCGLVHQFDGLTMSAHPAWPAYVKTIAGSGLIYPRHFLTPNFFAACRCVETLFADCGASA